MADADDPSKASASPASKKAAAGSARPEGGETVAAAPPERDFSAARKWGADLLSSLIKAVVMFVLGYLLIQSVELDLKQAQFTADAADKLRDYVVVLNSDAAFEDVETSKATALALGGFGGVAAYPLVQTIETGAAQRIAWAKLGLEQAGRIAPDDTCEVIEAVVDDPTDTYKWQTRKAAVEVAGSVGCPGTVESLQTLKQTVPKMSALDAVQRDNFVTAIERAITRVERAEKRRSAWWEIWR